MDGYLTKPLEPETLCAELCRWLRLPAEETDVRRPAVAAQRVLPGFDAAKVRRWQDAFPDTWRSMVRAFVADYPEAVTAIRTALDAGERTRAGDGLHRLRGASGALGAEELAEAAGRLELALGSDGPVDAGLRERFFASAAATLKVLAELEVPTVEDAAEGDTAPGCEEQSQHLRELEALLEAGNTRALDHVPWLEGWVDTEVPGGARELLRQIEALDFPAALETLRGLREGVFINPR
jgi:HPt (histidine-containing phosphotransfer) domain-containing protein